jgi:hypothetical protein
MGSKNGTPDVPQNQAWFYPAANLVLLNGKRGFILRQA